MFEPEMIRFLMVVIIGCGGQAVPQTDVIILYIVENVNGYAINMLMLASEAWGDQKIRVVYRDELGGNYRFFGMKNPPRRGGKRVKKEITGTGLRCQPWRIVARSRVSFPPQRPHVWKRSYGLSPARQRSSPSLLHQGG